MTILVCGSRGWTNREKIRETLSFFSSSSVILHGGARGADRMAGEEALRFGMTVKVFKPDWKRYGRGAGFKRNLQMLDEKPDFVVAFWDGESKGTLHTIVEAKERGIPTTVVMEEM